MARWLETVRRNRRASQAAEDASATCPRSTCSVASSATPCWPPISPTSAEKGSTSLRHRPGRPARPGGRARPRQRWPRSPGRLLHRLAGHHERAVHRLRHPLRVRHLPPDLRRRPPGRAAGHLAAAGRPVGVPAPGGSRPGRTSAATPRTTDDRRHRAHPLGAGLERHGRPLQLHGPRLPERPGEHPAAVERAGHQGVRPGDLQLRRLRGGRPRPDVRREHHQGALPRGLHAAGQGAAPAAAVLLRRLLDPRLHRGGAPNRTSTCTTCPSGSSSSSTTPTR